MPEEVKHIEWKDMDKRKFYFFGPTLFLGLRVFLYPVNLIKTRLQVQRKGVLYKGTFDAFSQIVRTEGPRGLYKGFMVSCVGLLSGQCYITTYELVRAKTDGYSYAVRGFLAGGCASLVGQTITVPVDILSQKLMVQGQNQPQVKIKGASTLVREILQTNGPAGFYKGYFASLMTYAPSSAIWWSAYGLYTDLLGSSVPSGTPHMFVLALAGSMAGATAASLTNPLDIVRTRLQVRLNSVNCSDRLVQLSGSSVSLSTYPDHISKVIAHVISLPQQSTSRPTRGICRGIQGHLMGSLLMGQWRLIVSELMNWCEIFSAEKNLTLADIVNWGSSPGTSQ